MGLYDSILVTGGRGMLAHAFAQALYARGVRVAVVGRQECDVAEPAQVVACFDRHRPTLVINCAAYTKVDQAEKEREAANTANGTGPAILAEQCRRAGAALVHFSTDYVFDGSLRRALRPDDPVGPQSAYGRSKLEGERAIQSDPPPRWLIARTAWLYGPNGPNFVQTMLNVGRAGKPLRVVDDQVGSPTYTFDLAAATLDLLDRGAAGIWHVSNAGQTSWFDFAKAIFQEWGLAPDLQPTTSAAYKAGKPDSAVRPAYSVFDLSPLEKLLGRPMRPWRDALHAHRLQTDGGIRTPSA
jgi:dTDP-4-dehydrorhamnose reductase